MKKIDEKTNKEIERITKRYIREMQLAMQRFANEVLSIEFETGK